MCVCAPGTQNPRALILLAVDVRPEDNGAAVGGRTRKQESIVQKYVYVSEESKSEVFIWERTNHDLRDETEANRIKG